MITAGVGNVTSQPTATERPRARPITRRRPARPRSDPRFPVCMVPLGEGGDGVCAQDPPPVVNKPEPRPTADVARNVGQRTPLPVPGIRTSPPTGADQLVNLPTWMWLENWAPASATATEGGLTVTVTATPKRVVWRMGAGDPVVCGAGRAWNPALREEQQSSDCTFTYRASSANQPDLMYRASATMVFDISWSATNGESGSLGQASTTTDFRMRVAEGQALVIG
ncbi:MAG TPA: hypothetical protein VFJ85_01225 [Acidimicrobiales bacterium]|nr:hypothetical protein [Acidimicrobiales bacterium]